MQIVEEEHTGILLPPRNAARSHVLGKVVGEGVADPYSERITDNGDVVLFQAPDYVLKANSFGDLKKPQVIMPRNDIIARLKSPKVLLENIEILGEWVLLKLVTSRLKSPIVIPDTAASTTNEFTRFQVVQVGKFVKEPISVNDEVVVDRGRANLMQLKGPNDGDPYTDYVYIHCGSIFGVLEGGGLAPIDSIPKPKSSGSLL